MPAHGGARASRRAGSRAASLGSRLVACPWRRGPLAGRRRNLLSCARGARRRGYRWVVRHLPDSLGLRIRPRRVEVRRPDRRLVHRARCGCGRPRHGTRRPFRCCLHGRPAPCVRRIGAVPLPRDYPTAAGDSRGTGDVGRGAVRIAPHACGTAPLAACGLRPFRAVIWLLPAQRGVLARQRDRLHLRRAHRGARRHGFGHMPAASVFPAPRIHDI